MSTATATPRRPSFLARISAGAPVVRLAFPPEARPGPGGPYASAAPSGEPGVTLYDSVSPEDGSAGPASAAGPVPPPAPAEGPPVDLSRLEAAIERLRLQADRLAAESRADALELALVLARKIVEGELTVNVDQVISLARSAIKRLGESRRIVVRLAPADAEVIRARSQGGIVDALSAGAAQVEIAADPSLRRGDCVVEGDLMAVDGRLDTRLAELRRLLTENALEEPK